MSNMLRVDLETIKITLRLFLLLQLFPDQHNRVIRRHHMKRLLVSHAEIRSLSSARAASIRS